MEQKRQTSEVGLLLTSYLYAGPGFDLAEATDERPAAGWNMRQFSDGFHPLWTRDAHLHTHTRAQKYTPTVPNLVGF